MDFAELEHLASTLATGFEALLLEVQTQRQKEKALRDRIAYAEREYTKIVRTLDGHSNRPPAEYYGEVMDSLRQDPTEQIETVNTLPLAAPAEFETEIQKAWQACKKLKPLNPVKEDVMRIARTCPVAHQTIDREDFEQDFTTPGVQGSLECPFAKMANNGLPHTPISTVDPIAAEFHPDQISVASPSAVAPATGKCPIRFLDQHSPEEVAKYFENHKHEIPRSHEICVKRYQANENSIRQLDAKYGNLVNMIQGLGVKHKAYLPAKDGTNASETRDPSSTRAVEKWAEDLSQKAEPVDVDAGHEADERTGHFEKPLREIRVGESPSRPWGIQIPVGEEPARSATEFADMGRPTIPRSVQNEVPAGCPFGHGKTHEETFQKPGLSRAGEDGIPALPADDFDDAKAGKREQSNQAVRPQIIFNAPVILGYAPEQAMAMLQAWKGV